MAKIKITDDDAVVIIIRLFLGESAMAIAREHGVTQGHISQLRHGYRPRPLKRALAYWNKYYPNTPPPPYARPGRRKE